MVYWFFHNWISIPYAVVSILRDTIISCFLAASTKSTARFVLEVLPANYYLWFRNRSGLGDETKCVSLCKLVEKSNITWAFEEHKVLRIHGNSSPVDYTKDLLAEA